MIPLQSIFKTLYRHHARNTILLLVVSLLSGLIELAGWGFITGLVQDYTGAMSRRDLALLVALLVFRQFGSVILGYLEIDITERMRQLIYRASQGSAQDKKSTYLVELRAFIAGCVTPGVKFSSEITVSAAVALSCVLLLPTKFLFCLAAALTVVFVATQWAAISLRSIGLARRQEDALIADSRDAPNSSEQHSLAISLYERVNKLTRLTPMLYAAAALLSALAYLLLAGKALPIDETVVSILLAMRSLQMLGNAASRYLRVELNRDLAFKFQQL